MRNVWGTEIAILPEDYPPPKALRERYRRCKCGEATFLDMPCRKCGRTDQEPVFHLAEKRSRADRRRRLLCGLLAVVVAFVLLALLWPPLLIPGCVVALVALRRPLVMGKAGDLYRCYWLFHRKKPSLFQYRKTLLAEPEPIQEMLTAYDADLGYLEKTLKSNMTSDNAKQILPLALSLTDVYRNRRLSAVLMVCLALLPASEGICVDLDLVCENLDIADFQGAETVLKKLYEYAQLSCLNPGPGTAKFVVRFCARRVQEKQRERHPEMTVEQAGQDVYRLADWLKEEERSMLSEIWYRSTIGAAAPDETAPELKRWTTSKKYVTLRQTPLAQLGEKDRSLETYWFDQVWYDATGLMGTNFRQLLRLSSNDFERELGDSWGKSGKQEG